MAKTFKIDAFKAWLIGSGAIIDPPTSEWEVLRVRTMDGTFVAYRNKSGAQTWPADLLQLKECFFAGKPVSLSPDRTSRRKLRHTISDLSARDGLWCWFCETGFLSADSAEITIEHLVSKAHGGPDHQSNLVLACKPCNGEVGNLSVAEKVLIRDRKRGFLCEPIRKAAAS